MRNRPLGLIRLGGLPLGLTLLWILAGSVINRVMVVELGLAVILAGLFLAVPLLISVLRIGLGHLSDAYPLAGLRREPCLILGAVLAGAGVALAVLPSVLAATAQEPGWSINKRARIRRSSTQPRDSLGITRSATDVRGHRSVEMNGCRCTVRALPDFQGFNQWQN